MLQTKWPDNSKVHKRNQSKADFGHGTLFWEKKNRLILTIHQKNHG
jgi:hypothetical protein